jgi:hypothetical protein
MEVVHIANNAPGEVVHDLLASDAVIVVFIELRRAVIGHYLV